MRIVLALTLITMLWTGGASPASAQQVTVTRSHSGQVYWVGAVRRWASIYSDRDYVFGGFPDCLEGRPYLITPNRDKFTRGPSLVELTVDQPVVTLIGYDTRYHTHPGWLTGHFDPTPHTITVTDRSGKRTVLTFRIWRSKADRQHQVLGGNLHPGETANNGMYIAVFLPSNMRPCVP